MRRDTIQLCTAVVAVVFAAFLLRWYFVASVMVDNPFRGDAYQYYSYAWNLIQHHTFSVARPGSDLVLPDSFREPGYPVFLAAWMLVTDDLDRWYAAVLLCQALLGALTAGLTVLLSRLCMPLAWSVGCGVLIAIWPHNIAISEYLLSESLFAFLLVLALVLVAYAIARQAFWSFAAGGVCLSFAALVNPVVLPLAVLLPLHGRVRGRIDRRSALALVICALALPIGWNVRSMMVAPGPMSSKDRALLNLDQGAWPDFFAQWRSSVGVEPDAARDMPLEGREERKAKAREALAPMKREQDLMLASPAQGIQAMVQRFAASPARYAFWYFVEKPMLFWGWSIQVGQGDVYVNPTRNSPLDRMPLRAVVALCHGLNLVTGIAALLLSLVAFFFRNRCGIGTLFPDESDRSIISMLALVLLFATAVHVVLQAEPRYSIPFRPIEMILAVGLIAGLARSLPVKSKQQPGPIV